jgi:hypothetical protein
VGKTVKPKRGLGQAITRRRRQAAEEIRDARTNRIDRERAAARAEIERALAAAKNRAKTDTTAWGQALLRAVVANQTAVMRAWGLRQSVSFAVNQGANVVAWTDFQQVRVEWPVKSLPARLDRIGTLDIVARMKGVMQHEAGHCRFSTPWPTLVEATGIPAKHRGHDSQLKTMCNVLEDQRMETRVVQTVPRIANYFGTMVINIVIGQGDEAMDQSWLLLAGREYLPFNLLSKSYMAFDEFCMLAGVANGAATWYNLVDAYKTATTYQQLMTAISDAYDFLLMVKAQMPKEMDDHNRQQRGGQGTPEQGACGGGSLLDQLTEKAEQGKGDGMGSDMGEAGDKPGKGKGKGKGEGDGEEGDGEGTGKAKSDKEGKGKSADRQEYGEEYTGPKHKSDGTRSDDLFGSEGQANGGEGDEEWADQDVINQADTLSEAFAEASKALSEDIRSHADVREMAATANTFKDTEGLPEYPGTGEAMSSELVERSMETARGVEQALNNFLTQNEPSWHSRQDRGVVEALAYRTKEPGDRNFRRHLEDHGLQGLDVHVSMICDVSYSMSGGPIVALSEALYATALACGNLGIESTFTLWSSGDANYRVWGDGHPTASVWPAMGGTDPTAALDDLETHNQEEAENHLVIIFTDGQWAHNFPSLTRWGAPNRTIVLVRYGAYDGAIQTDMGADRHIAINDIRQLPHQLTNSLIDVLSGRDGNGW